MLFLKSQNIEMKPHVFDNTFYGFSFWLGPQSSQKELLKIRKIPLVGNQFQFTSKKMLSTPPLSTNPQIYFFITQKCGKRKSNRKSVA